MQEAAADPSNEDAQEDAAAALFRIDRVITGFVVLILANVAGYAFLFWPVRNGDRRRGFHGLWSRTNVVSLSKRKRATGPRMTFEFTGPESTPIEGDRRFGPFNVKGRIHKSESEELWAAHDDRLNRPVWIYTSDSNLSDAKFTDARRSVARQSRPRWIAGGVQDNVRWEAFEAVPGDFFEEAMRSPKRRAIRHGRSTARQWASDLACELRESKHDDTLPEEFNLSLLWVGNDGRLRFLDAPLRRSQPGDTSAQTTNDTNSPDEFMEQAISRLQILSRREQLRLILLRFIGPFLFGLLGFAGFLSDEGIVGALFSGIVFASFVWFACIWVPAFVTTLLFGTTYFRWRMKLAVYWRNQPAPRLLLLARLLLPVVFYGIGIAISFAAISAGGRIVVIPFGILWIAVLVSHVIANLWLPPDQGVVDRILGTRLVSCWVNRDQFSDQL